MSETTIQKAAEPELRVDEHALSMFQHLGFSVPLPDGLVRAYGDFKRVKDRIRPGNLSAEGYAFVVSLFELKRELGA